ncbi:hypothetical protein SOASR030_21610 [Leminorella grimontii]|uniref:Lipoprotein n=1 Tax=Leminorella grimontii TaxID=82981 RepID=A0AAV5N2W4_9GAMM|nr:hypothetical protein [Leminorella grimontii]KFC96903.1 hypothetical protein GLGR_0903 [Leminorella grimontii ATCC 33999 = DSM 5078]GKX56049.1 hypothetical protein SOASR030_21610 [Leminorella grimontii]GKX59102.1 hypothetical protein SOASR031_14170 [Leminorella grimontii]VFS57782.1 Uncharacterised protein [Leminorella grimontii]
MKRILLLSVLSASLLLGGCASLQPGTGRSQSSTQNSSASYSKQFQSCLTRLDTVRTLDANVYHQYKQQLDKDMEEATRYLNVRSSLSDDMSGVMDSIYQANLSRTCQKIDSQLMSLLIERADRK